MALPRTLRTMSRESLARFISPTWLRDKVKVQAYPLPWHHDGLFGDANIIDPGSCEHEILAWSSDRIPETNISHEHLKTAISITYRILTPSDKWAKY